MLKRLISLAVAGCVVIGSGVAPALAENPIPKKDWTFLVWMNGDNNLDPYTVKDLNELEKVGSTDRLTILSVTDHEHSGAVTYLVTKDDQPDTITSKVLADLGEIDMGSGKLMAKMASDLFAKYPANHYAIVIWNHGSGWDRRDRRAPVLRGISYDDTNGTHITTAQLGTACAEIAASIGHKLDVLAMDACLMQMAEVCYELKDSTAYVAASEEVEPGEGYAYDMVVGPIAKKPEMTGAELSSIIANAFAASLPGQESITQSAVDCGEIDGFSGAFDAFCTLLIEKMADKAVARTIKSAVRANVQKFEVADNVDLGHFLSLVQTNVKDKAVSEAAAKALAHYRKVVIANATGGANMANATGLAIYYPKTSISAAYSSLKWSKTAWTRFLRAYYAALATRK